MFYLKKNVLSISRMGNSKLLENLRNFLQKSSELEHRKQKQKSHSKYTF